MTSEENETFVSEWLTRIRDLKPDSVVQASVSAATNNDILDEDALLSSLIAASDTKEGEDVASRSEDND